MNLDEFTDPEKLRAYVKDLMNEMKNNHSTNHPSILKGETVENVVKETEKYKKQVEQTERKINELRVQNESQRRFMEKLGGVSALSTR